MYKEFELTEEQKMAILYHLFILAQADGEINEREILSIEQSAHVINFDFDPKNLSPLISKIFKQKNNIIINEIPRNVKEWFVIAMYSLIVADGKIHTRELNESIRIAGSIGISETEYKNIIDKTISLYNMFNSDKLQ